MATITFLIVSELPLAHAIDMRDMPWSHSDGMHAMQESDASLFCPPEEPGKTESGKCIESPLPDAMVITQTESGTTETIIRIFPYAQPFALNHVETDIETLSGIYEHRHKP